MHMKTHFGHHFMIHKIEKNWKNLEKNWKNEKKKKLQLICEKTASLSQKMMIYHKKYMSGV